MCKIMLMPGITEETADKAWEFAKKIAPDMSRNDKDGMGYAAITKKGHLFAERWKDPSDFFVKRDAYSKFDYDLVNNLGCDNILEIIEKKYSSHGTISEDNLKATNALILHARMATCEKSLENVHPFIRDNVALIHNGVIRNHLELLKKTSTCDSETILNEYVDSEVAKTPKNIKDVAESLQGYYACGVLGTDAKGMTYLDIFKSQTANLYCTFVNELNTTVYCTSDTMIKDACESLKWTHGKIFTPKKDIMFRIDAKTGKCVNTYKFESTEWASVSRLPTVTKKEKIDIYGDFEEDSEWTEQLGEMLKNGQLVM